MRPFKDYLWERIREGMLFAWISALVISILIYAGLIYVLKEKQLVSSLRVAAYTVHESMNAGEWALALGHLTKLEENGPVFNIELSSAKSNKANLTGPFGQKPFGLGKVCKVQAVDEGVTLRGCMVLFGGGEQITLILFVLIASVISIILFKTFSAKIFAFIEKISNTLKSIGAEEIDATKHDEIAEIASIQEYILSLLNEVKEASKSIAFSQLSVQVAHDIRSPLSALDVAMKDVASVPEEKRILIRNAVNRIRDVANNLLKYRRMEIVDNAGDKFAKPSMIISMLDLILSEKRTQYRNKPIKFELEIDNDACVVFALVHPSEFKRMISNLIDNSVEAIYHTEGKVTITLRREKDRVQINIHDNGSGIPQHILSKLFSEKISYGKESGNGLGLNHAHSLVQLWYGEINIDSKIGDGTNVSILFPISVSPIWFADSINIIPGKSIVILDDDPSIHQVWGQRFNELLQDGYHINAIHFADIAEFRKWLNEGEINVDNHIYLIDYEILGEEKTGIDLINEFKIHENATLVTSRHEESNVIDQCVESGIRLLPKTISAFIPIRICHYQEYDAVLIDDDLMMHELWSLSAIEHKKNIKLFSNPDKFFLNKNEISRNTIIYIDSILGEDCHGEVIAKDIFHLGFKKIYLVTGMPANYYEEMPYLRGVLNKIPPWEMDLEGYQ